MSYSTAEGSQNQPYGPTEHTRPSVVVLLTTASGLSSLASAADAARGAPHAATHASRSAARAGSDMARREL